MDKMGFDRWLSMQCDRKKLRGCEVSLNLSQRIS